jgi:uncharacterized protein YjcR
VIQHNGQLTSKQATSKYGTSEQTYYRWRKEYGWLKVDQARGLKKLEQENAYTNKSLYKDRAEPLAQNVAPAC